MCLRVALRKESVDRNRDQLDVAMSGAVALRKESVDRNRGGNTHANRYYVALRKESVDRNRLFLGVARCKRRSLSARRAWIEINKTWDKTISRASLSARRAWIEIFWLSAVFLFLPSLSTRRAWIEIRTKGGKVKIESVALRKESVDRNC